jgi:hypothetical protein
MSIKDWFVRRRVKSLLRNGTVVWSPSDGDWVRVKPTQFQSEVIVRLRCYVVAAFATGLWIGTKLPSDIFDVVSLLLHGAGGKG